MTSVNPLLAILRDCLTEAVAVSNLGSRMWSHPRFRSFTGFRFSKDTRRNKLGWLERIAHLRFDVVSKARQSIQFLRNLADLGMTGLLQILWLSSIMIGRWLELPIDSASLQNVSADQLLPQREMSGVLSFPVIWPVRVAESLLRMYRSLSRIH